MTEARILVVEDDEVLAAFIVSALNRGGYYVRTTPDGGDALRTLEAEAGRYLAILLGHSPPRLDGMAVLRQIKAIPTLARIPVILQTATGEQDEIREGLAAGAYYNLVKPFQGDLLVAIVTAAIAQYCELLDMREAVRRAERALRHLNTGTFTIRSIEEARELANMLAGGFPDPDRVVVGLQELLINAVEHGNLGITYKEKTALVMGHSWREEVERRLMLPENRDKVVSVLFERTPGTITLTIRDEGQGFDWRSYLDFDPDRAFDPHGRGIAMARSRSFDTIEYIGNGNTVRVTVEVV